MRPIPDEMDGALLGEAVLAEDWMRPEEDAAWEHLQAGDPAEDEVPDSA